MSEGGDDLFARGDPGHHRPILDGQPFELPGELGGIRRPLVSRSIQAQIGTALRSMYEELLAEPAPEAFADLIRRLR